MHPSPATTQRRVKRKKDIPSGHHSNDQIVRRDSILCVPSILPGGTSLPRLHEIVLNELDATVNECAIPKAKNTYIGCSFIQCHIGNFRPADKLPIFAQGLG